jgi:hypothetical protein
MPRTITLGDVSAEQLDKALAAFVAYREVLYAEDQDAITDDMWRDARDKAANRALTFVNHLFLDEHRAPCPECASTLHQACGEAVTF